MTTRGNKIRPAPDVPGVPVYPGGPPGPARRRYRPGDRYGNAVERGELTDQRGRSPSQQVNEPASQLEDFLRSGGHRVAIERFVLLAHPRSRLGSCLRPKVHIATTTSQVISLLDDSATDISEPECAKLERLIVRDHRFHSGRRRP